MMGCLYQLKCEEKLWEELKPTNEKEADEPRWMDSAVLCVVCKPLLNVVCGVIESQMHPQYDLNTFTTVQLSTCDWITWISGLNNVSETHGCQGLDEHRPTNETKLNCWGSVRIGGTLLLWIRDFFEWTLVFLSLLDFLRFNYRNRFTEEESGTWRHSKRCHVIFTHCFNLKPLKQ